MENLNNNILKIGLIFICLIFLLLISFFMKSLDIKYYQIFILFFYIFVFLLSLKKNYMIISLFLITLFTFQYGRMILLPLLCNIEISITWFYNYIFTKSTLYFMYDLLFFNLIGIFLCILYFDDKKIKLEERQEEEDFFRCIKKIIILLFGISFLFFIVNNFIFLKELYTKGNYVEIFLTMTSSNSNILIRGIAAIFYPLLIILLAFYNNKKPINYILFLFLVIANFIFSLKGTRAPFINSIFIVIYFYLKKINIKNSIIILLTFSILIFFSQFVLNIRLNEKYTNFNFRENIIGFLYSQGTTGTYLGLLKDKPELFSRKVPYIFSSVVGEKIISQTEKNDKVLFSGNIGLAYQLSARSNNEMYKKGYGMGGNYIIEMYDFLGKYGIIFLSFLHTYFSLYFFSNINKFNYYVRILLILILENYFLIPRVSYLPFISYLRISYIVIIYFFLYIVYKFKNAISRIKDGAL